MKLDRTTAAVLALHWFNDIVSAAGALVVLVADSGVDVVQGDVVDGGDAVTGLACGDELGDGLGAGARGEVGFAEEVIGVEGNRNGATEGVEAAASRVPSSAKSTFSRKASAVSVSCSVPSRPRTTMFSDGSMPTCFWIFSARLRPDV